MKMNIKLSKAALFGSNFYGAQWTSSYQKLHCLVKFSLVDLELEIWLHYFSALSINHEPLNRLMTECYTGVLQPYFDQKL